MLSVGSSALDIEDEIHLDVDVDSSDESMSSSSSSSSSSNNGNNNNNNQHMHSSMDGNNRENSMPTATSNTTIAAAAPANDEDDVAYWIQRTIREAIYGRVVLAVILRKRRPDDTSSAAWEVTDMHAAVKELSWHHIRRERHNLAEDPIKEVAAMQFLKQQQQQMTTSSMNSEPLYTNTEFPLRPTAPASLGSCGDVSVYQSFESMVQANVMMPLDLLSDEKHLYSIMPYCNGGELFELLDQSDRFTEPEARYWMEEILNGIETLQKGGICHRDLSLENLLVHESGALIIDMGMCLRIPFKTTTTTMADTNMATNSNNYPMDGLMTNGTFNDYNHFVPEANASNPGKYQRCLLRPQGTCGKWIYMSPEIVRNRDPFDGFAVDMWAAGVILFLMLAGFPPWDRACGSDERFRYMSAGYLVQMLTEWNVPISPDAMDLLQRMLFLDPKDRLSLRQVRAHPWMINTPPCPPIRRAAGITPNE
jgi:serine/threonine protein kinase